MDSVPCKAAWAKSLGGLSFDLLSDFYPHGEVASRFRVLNPDGVAERAVFLVDRRGLIVLARTYAMGAPPDIADVWRGLAGLKD